MLKKLLIFIFLLAAIWYPLKTEASTTSATLNQKLNSSTVQNPSTTSQTKEVFQQKLAAIKDAKKKILVQKINDKIADLNKRATNKMSLGLTNISTILTNLDTRAKNMKTAGKDTTAYDAASLKAKNAITTAAAAVSAQAAKTYTVTITTEGALKINVGATVSQFRLDLVAVHKLVVDAKQAVWTAAKELAKLKGGGKEATNSASTK